MFGTTQRWEIFFFLTISLRLQLARYPSKCEFFLKITFSPQSFIIVFLANLSVKLQKDPHWLTSLHVPVSILRVCMNECVCYLRVAAQWRHPSPSEWVWKNEVQTVNTRQFVPRSHRKHAKYIIIIEITSRFSHICALAHTTLSNRQAPRHVSPQHEVVLISSTKGVFPSP